MNETRLWLENNFIVNTKKLKPSKEYLAFYPVIIIVFSLHIPKFYRFSGFAHHPHTKTSFSDGRKTCLYRDIKKQTEQGEGQNNKEECHCLIGIQKPVHWLCAKREVHAENE